ncbi:MAG: fluoride efflux transporter CrcB [Hamadaea sp.]|nr:fluoride efflux transporter CrcB [Hamadaea sp.]
MTVLLVVLGAAVGAPLRYLVDRAVQARHDSVFPWGTFAVNVSGSFLLGSLVAWAVSAPAFALLGTGLCGALTTWSTLGYETVRLAQTGARPLAVVNVVGSIVAGLLAAWLGLTLFS